MTANNPSPSTLGAPGEHLVIHDWPLPIGQPIRGMVLMLHGLGEHIGLYTELADQLNRWGFAARGYDHYGHGESDGTRGDLPEQGRLVTDLASLIDDTRMRMDDRLPLIALGHGLGGLTAALLVSMRLRRLDGLALSSPPLATHTTLWQRASLAIFRFVAPRFRFDSGLHANELTHDRSIEDTLRHDGLRHNRMSVRLAHYVIDSGAALIARAPRWNTPTLLLYAGQDKVVDPEGSRRFAQAAPAEYMTAHHFPMHFHALFLELERQPVFDALQRWLWERYPPLSLERSWSAE